jgi:ABC-type bacteriocin/lantibiotic exporter with double-glycine peptidase domain
MAGVEYSSNKPVKRLGRLLRSERKIIYLILFYALVNGIIVLTLPLGIQAILNFIMGGRVTSSWVILIVIVVLGLTISGLIQIAQMTLTEKLQQRIFAKSSFELAVRIPKIKVEAFQNRYAPEMMNQFFDTINLQKGLAKLLVDFPTATLQVLFGLILISVYHPFFLFFSLIIIFLLWLLFRYTGPQGVITSLKESSHKYEVAHWLEEVARTMGTFKLAGITDLPLLKVDKLIMGYLYFRRKHFGILITQFKTMIAFKVITTGALLIMGSILLIDNQISLGQFVAAEIIIILIMNSIEKLIVGLESVYDVLTSVEKLGALTDMPLEEDNVKNPPNLTNSEAFGVNVEALRFRYPGTERTIIDKISFEIDQGKKVVLTGTAGSGKTTLLQLLTGIYENYKGRITYNGVPLSALCHDDLRLQIGDNIWQETIFKGSVRENITLGKQGVTDDMVMEALEAVSAINSLNMLDEGLNTLLFPEGVKIPRSLGKKIILARSMVSHPKLLLMEMETDFMTNSEREKFYTYLLSKPWTLIAVSDEGKFIQRADRVMFLDKGKISFEGKFDEFKNSGYAEFIRE